jgi:uncharacterized protein DUF6232
MQAGGERVLYEGRSGSGGARIWVTERWCVVDGGRYRIAELDLLGVTRGRRDLLHGRKVLGLGLVLTALAVVLLAIGSGWTREIRAALVVTAIGTAAVTAVPSILARVLRRPYEIWARYRGGEVLLFATEDAEQYGQVARALVRARELHGR